MVEFDHSIDAKNVLNKFYRVEKIVYVEGDDDVAFWEYLFERFFSLSVEIEAVGGKVELKRISELIHSNEAEYIVAMDSDYDDFSGFDYHPNILRTYGYSIENTMVSRESICKILKTIARLPNKEVPVELCDEWLKNLSERLRPFVLNDLVSTIDKNGVNVLPNGSDRFMSSKKSCEICSDKVNVYLESLPIAISENRISEEDNALIDKGLSYLDVLKGHFLLSAVMRFIKIQAERMNKGLSISSGMLYSNLVSVFENVFNENHAHFEYYKESFSVIEVRA